MKKYIELNSCADCPEFKCRKSEYDEVMKCMRCGSREFEKSEYFNFPEWCPLMSREQLEDRWMKEDDANTGSCIGDRESLCTE